MGADALEGNGITRRIFYFFRDRALTPDDEPLRRVRKSRILLFVAVQLVAFGATMAITQTIGKDFCPTFVPKSRPLNFYYALSTAAIGFPIIILLLIPLRTLLIPLLPFSAEELNILDGPTASAFVSNI